MSELGNNTLNNHIHDTNIFLVGGEGLDGSISVPVIF